MGNFVSLTGSYPTATPRRRDDIIINTYEPKLPPPIPIPTPLPSSSVWCYPLTSSLASRTRRLIKRLCRLTGMGGIRLTDVEEGLPPDCATTAAAQVAQPPSFPSSARRRALLIGISYHGELLNTHQDVDRYRDVLIVTYGYRPEDIILLKDDPAFGHHLQPTRENILRELRSLVADAAAGDRFTFLFSGHSNQQPSKDLNEEDFLDEYLITIDDEIIIDNELNDILVKPLPAGSSLFALLDTCHSGTLLDLPHYYCNTVFVPWHSKGKRRTNSLQNVIVRRNAAYIQNPLPEPAPRSSPILSSILAQSKSTERMDPVLPIFVNIPLGTDRRDAPTPKGRSARHLRDYNSTCSPQFCTSPVSRLPCNGWCMPDPNVKAPTVVSLAACSDDQRSWEAYESSLTRVVCNFLGQNQRPSYKDLMTHINFKLHATSRQLHEWTRSEKIKHHKQAAETAKAEHADPCSEKPSRMEAKAAETLEGEMDNFQTPLLSSLVPLNMQDTLQV